MKKSCSFGRTLTEEALVDILIAGSPGISWWAGADGLAVDRVGITVGALLAGVTDAGIVKVT